MHQGSWSNYHFLDELYLGLEPNEQRKLMSSDICHSRTESARNVLNGHADTAPAAGNTDMACH